ncbi:Floricaula/Leafy protein, SAM domain [Sesbania bispinosa]|nr:Floricaula/Leafy protein, SAM domain [Sesbania bispinosa]
MDPDPFTSNLFKWDPRPVLPTVPPATRLPLLEYTMPPPRELQAAGLEELFHAYGVRYFTANTLVDMKDEEIDDMMNNLSQIFRWDLLVGERYGIKAAIRAERRRIHGHDMRRRNPLSADTTNALDALSQEGACASQFQIANTQTLLVNFNPS